MSDPRTPDFPASQDGFENNVATLDLSGREVPADTGEGAFFHKRRTPEEHEGLTRTVIAGGLVALLAGVLLLPLLLVVTCGLASGVMDAYLEKVYPPLLTLVGSVAGYYFGQQKRR